MHFLQANTSYRFDNGHMRIYGGAMSSLVNSGLLANG
jgi:hypothetical protein